jgi:hypothetical protein
MNAREPNNNLNNGRALVHPQKAKTLTSVGKEMASIFWDADCILVVCYLYLLKV